MHACILANYSLLIGKFGVHIIWKQLCCAVHLRAWIQEGGERHGGKVYKGCTSCEFILMKCKEGRHTS